MQTEVSVMYLGDLCLTDNGLGQIVGFRHIYTEVKHHGIFFIVILIALLG